MGDDTNNTKDQLKAYFADLIAGHDRDGAPSKPSQSDQPPADQSSDSKGSISFDEKGNPVWKWKTETEDRDPCAETLDLVKSLDNDKLALEDTEPKARSADDAGRDPYNNARRKI